jgi:Rieske 2Fe-2S family protein
MRTARGQRTLPGEMFTSEAVFREERERVFGGRWLYAGHVSEIPQPGDYVLFELDAESVIVLRDAEGGLRALHNVCRHRGSRLCLEAAGSLGRTIRCPYHAWAYALDGTLRAAPNMAEVAGFDRADHPLAPAALAERHGLVFVHLGSSPPPLDEELAGLAGPAGRFDRWRIAELRRVHRTVYEIEANWKLLFHNYSECYHCPTVHPHLERLTPFRNTTNDLEEGPVLGGPMWMNDPDGSMTLGGARCAPLLDGLAESDRGHVAYYTVFPSMFLSLHPDYVLVHRAQPLAPARTRVVCDWLFHPRAIEAPGFDATPAIEFWDLTNRQDWELCANAQRGVASRAYAPGPYAEIESQLAAFDREYLRAMGAAPERAGRAAASRPPGRRRSAPER